MLCVKPWHDFFSYKTSYGTTILKHSGLLNLKLEFIIVVCLLHIPYCQNGTLRFLEFYYSFLSVLMSPV